MHRTGFITIFKSMKWIFLLCFLLFMVKNGSAQITFQKTYGGPCCDWGTSVKQTADGGYIIAGTNNGPDLYLFRTNGNGDLLWAKSYGGTGYDFGYAVQQTTDGGFVLVGNTDSFGAGAKDVYLIRTDANGDALWTKTFGGAGNDEGFSVQQTSDGGYIMTGRTNSFGTYDVYVIKTDASGNLLWSKTYGGTLGDKGSSVEQTTDGGYIITGETSSFGAGASDIYLIRTDSIGSVLWSKTFGETFEEHAYSGQQTSDGGFILTGETQNGSSVCLIKSDANGNALWSKNYSTMDDDNGYSVQQSSDGGYIIAGKILSLSAPNSDAYLIKTNSTGDTLWTKTLGGSGYDACNAVEQTNDGGYILVGSIGSFGSPYHVYLIKTDVNGNSGCNETNAITYVSVPATIVTTPATLTASPNTVVTTPATNIVVGGADSTLCTTVGINELSETNTFLVFPNPFSNELIVTSGDGMYAEFILYDMSLRKLLQQKVTSGVSINTEILAKGIYLYELRNESGLRKQGKVVKD